MNKYLPVEKTIKENLAMVCPEDITESVMKEIRVNYSHSHRKIEQRVVYSLILISSLLMVGLLFLFSLAQYTYIGDNGIVRFSFNYLAISKFIIGIWKLKYFPIFIISFSLIIFIDIFFIKRKKPIYH